MSAEYKTYSLDINRVENLKKIMIQNGINYRSDADAIYKAIDKYITDFKLRSGANNNPIKNIPEESL
ncbi:MAG TPA: hypothetical protein VMV43_01265 [Candidatus Nanopelagicaceae bacterium]|nr:hypothetical protein [Candidatus Nanopelagicaceae bacterium]